MSSRRWPPSWTPGFGHCQGSGTDLRCSRLWLRTAKRTAKRTALTSSLRYFVPAFFGAAGEAGDAGAGEAGEAGDGGDAGAAGAAGADFRKVSRLSVCSFNFFLIWSSSACSAEFIFCISSFRSFKADCKLCNLFSSELASSFSSVLTCLEVVSTSFLWDSICSVFACFSFSRTCCWVSKFLAVSAL